MVQYHVLARPTVREVRYLGWRATLEAARTLATSAGRMPVAIYEGEAGRLGDLVEPPPVTGPHLCGSCQAELVPGADAMPSTFSVCPACVAAYEVEHDAIAQSVS